MPSTPPPVSTGICSQPNCGKPLRARGFCVTCYYKFMRRGDLQSGTPTQRWIHRLSNINPEVRTAICTECGEVKITPRGNNRWRCKHKGLNERAKIYKRAYREAKKVMMIDHCEICGGTNKLCWDHDHQTGKFRGTLCNACNFALGGFRDSVEILSKAVEYLQKANRKENQST